MKTIEEYAREIGVPAEELTGKGKSERVALPREVYWYYQRKHGMTFTDIARPFNRSHSSVMSGIKTVESMIATKDRSIKKYLRVLGF